MTAQKKQIINWPTAVIVISLIGTMAALFSPLINPNGKEKKSKMVSGSSDLTWLTKDLKRLEMNFQNLRSETKQEAKYRREDFKYIKEELREIKKQVFVNSTRFVKRSR